METIARMVLLPVGSALFLRWLLKERGRWLYEIMPRISMALLVGVLAFITAAGRDNLLTMGLLLLLVVVIHNVVGFVIGYSACRLLKMDEKTARTISIEVGMQNGGLAGGIATEMGRAATMGLAPAVFSSVQNVTGSLLANWWRTREPSPAGGEEPGGPATAEQAERVPSVPIG
jgi:BASS family bile acid:Na+ symporter